MSLKDKQIIRQFQFRSSSNPSIVYATLLYSDGTASCNCPGWTRRVASDGSRTCKHIIVAGIAPVSVSEPEKPKFVKGQSMKHGDPAPVMMNVVRKFKFDDD